MRLSLSKNLPFKLIKFLLFCCCLAFSGKLAAQVPFFRNLEVESESNESKVRTIYQDKKGFIWLGTSDGLFRYNGLGYTPFSLPDSAARQQVTAIAEDKKGTLWVGYQSGKIARIINGKFSFYQPEEGTPDVPIQAIHQSKDSTMWFATYGEGVYYLKNRHLYNINKADGLKDEYVYTLTEDITGNIWIGTDGGIAILSLKNNKKQVKTITSAQGLPDNIVLSLAFCNQGSLWIGTHSSGVCRYRPSTQKFEIVTDPSSENNAPVSQLVPVGSEMWAATLGNGIAVYDQKNMDRKQVFTREAGSLPKVTSLLHDREGNVWIAGNSPVFQVVNPQFRFVAAQQNQPWQNIRAVLQSRKGDLWVCSPDGLVKQDKTGTRKKYLPNAVFSKVQPVSLYEDTQGFIWIGTFGNGVFRLNPTTEKLEHFNETSGLINNNVLSIAGSGNDVWLATLGGVSRFSLPAYSASGAKPAFQNFSQENGLGVNYIYHVFVDSRKRVWFGTDGRGVTMLENGKFRNFSEKDGLQSEIIYTVTEDKQGTIWFNTRKGLYNFDGQKIKPYTLPKSLKASTFSSIIADKAGNLILIHKEGIGVLHPATGRFIAYGAETGLAEPDADLNAVSRDAAGNIWIGMQQGLVQFIPETNARPAMPKMVLNEVQLFLKPLGANSKPEFSHDQNHISFDYVGLWYQNPEAVSYQVKLDGYDREWISSRNRFITYPNLPPGKYTFRVKASAANAFANAPETTYQFTINPPFWNTIPFYILAALALATVGYTVMKTRERKLKDAERMEKEKAMFQFETLKSQVNPHFLFNSFNTLISIIEDDQEKAVTYVEKLSDFFRDMLVYREKDVITLQEELQLIGNYYFLQQQRFGDNFKLNIAEIKDADQWYIAPLTLQLLVENAVKHNVVSKGYPLVVKIYKNNENYLVVENAIRKKKILEPSTRIGLQNIVNRYKLLNKKPVKIEPSETVFSVAVPLIEV